MVHNDELDRLLADRHVPEMRSNLEHRILQASLQGTMAGVCERERKKRSVLKTFFDFCLVPRPAFAMVVVLFLGVAMGGVYVPESTDGIDVDAFFLTAANIADMESLYE